MTERQLELTNILRLYNLSLSLAGLIGSLILGFYTALFVGISFTGSEASTSESAFVGGLLGLFFGVFALLYIIFTIMHGVIAWKLDQGERWVWVSAVILLIVQLFNIYFLPINIYFLIQLFKPEIKDYYTE